MARARDVADLDCAEPFARAAARVLEVRAAEVFEHADGVLDLDDIERVHDMRVATRRLRAALEVFDGCFPDKRRRKGLKGAKALADAMAVLIERLRDEQREANDALAAFVTPKRLRRLRRRLRRLVKAAAT